MASLGYSQYGLISAFYIEFLNNWNEGVLWNPQYFHTIVNTCLSAYQFMQLQLCNLCSGNVIL